MPPNIRTSDRDEIGSINGLVESRGSTSRATWNSAPTPIPVPGKYSHRESRHQESKGVEPKHGGPRKPGSLNPWSGVLATSNNDIHSNRKAGPSNTFQGGFGGRSAGPHSEPNPLRPFKKLKLEPPSMKLYPQLALIDDEGPVAESSGDSDVVEEVPVPSSSTAQANAKTKSKPTPTSSTKTPSIKNLIHPSISPRRSAARQPPLRLRQPSQEYVPPDDSPDELDLLKRPPSVKIIGGPNTALTNDDNGRPREKGKRKAADLELVENQVVIVPRSISPAPPPKGHSKGAPSLNMASLTTSRLGHSSRDAIEIASEDDDPDPMVTDPIQTSDNDLPSSHDQAPSPPRKSAYFQAHLEQRGESSKAGTKELPANFKMSHDSERVGDHRKDAIAPGMVKKRVQAIEDTVEKPLIPTSLPGLLNQIPNSSMKPSKRAQMKPRDPSQSGDHSQQPETSKSDFYAKPTKGVTSLLDSKFHYGKGALPLVRWFLGPEEMNADNTNAPPPHYWLRWTKEKLEVVTDDIQKRKPTEKDWGIVEIQIRKDIVEFEYSKHDMIPVVLTLEVNPSYKCKSPSKFDPYMDKFTFEFCIDSNSWLDTHYKQLVDHVLQWNSPDQPKRRVVNKPLLLLEAAEHRANHFRQAQNAPPSGKSSNPTAGSESKREGDSDVAPSRKSKKLVQSPQKSDVISGRRPTRASLRMAEPKHIEIALSPTEQLEPPRRSGRRSKEAVSAADNEIILAYPPVDIIRSDLSRLEPDELFNDTLIEFGLKYWTNNLRETNPELWDQIWVFNSFFYKKLSAKNFEEGYKSVRKWTSKVNIFDKKYIVVPINEHLHWYLAIIYYPEHILQSPPPKEVPMRSTRAHPLHTTADGTTGRRPGSQELLDPQDSSNVEEAERAEVDAELLNENTSEAASISGVSWKGLMEIDEKEERARSLVLTSKTQASELTNGKLRELDDDGDVVMESDPPTDNEEQGASKFASMIGRLQYPDSETDQVASGSLDMDTSNLSRSLSPFANLQSDSPPDASIRLLDGDLDSKAPPEEEGPTPLVDDESRTYIFVLDSLGGKHPTVIKTLKNWLKAEALDKMKQSETIDAKGCNAPVLYQPNHTDCGVYLLHFAETFMKRPLEFKQLLVAKKNAKSPNAERNKVWEKHLVKTKRVELKNIILGLSTEWMTQRKLAAEPGSRSAPPVAEGTLPAGSATQEHPPPQDEMKQQEASNQERQPPPTIQIGPDEDHTNPLSNHTTTFGSPKKAEGTASAAEIPSAQKPPDHGACKPDSKLQNTTPADEGDSDVEIIGVTPAPVKSKPKPRGKVPKTISSTVAAATRLR